MAGKVGSPFDETEYKRLLKGLEVSEVSLHVASEESDNGRLDSEFFQKKYLQTSVNISNLENDFLSAVTLSIQHPSEVTRVYEDSGLQILLAQNVRDNKLDFSNIAFMSHEVEKKKGNCLGTQFAHTFLW